VSAVINTREIAEDYRLAHWAQIMHERTQSGLSIKAYCKQIGICGNTYFYWQRRVREEKRSEKMKDQKIYVLQHSYDYGEDNEHEETKFIGVYSSVEQAKGAINRLKEQEGFRSFSTDCFYIDEYQIDKDQWVEGFISYRRKSATHRPD